MGIDISMNSNTLPPILIDTTAAAACGCLPTNPPDKTPQSFFFSSLLPGGPHDDQIAPDLGEGRERGGKREERKTKRESERERGREGGREREKERPKLPT